MCDGAGGRRRKCCSVHYLTGYADRESDFTGAASGIGRAIAQRFAQEGASVRLVDIDEKAAADAAREIVEAGGTASTHACDVSNQRCVEELFRKLAGQKPIDVLVNNAGISHIGKLETTT